MLITGAGNFGSVMKGVYQRGGQSIPVAVKTLKQDELPNAEVSKIHMAEIYVLLSESSLPRKAM